MNPVTAQALLDEFIKLGSPAAAVRSAILGAKKHLIRSSPFNPAPGSRSIRKNMTDAVKSFRHPVDSFKRGVRHTARDTKSFGGKAFLVGGTALGLPTVASKQDPSGEGRSRLHRAAEFAGGEVGGIMGAPFGLSGAMTASAIGGVIGNRAGALADRVRGYRPQAPARV